MQMLCYPRLLRYARAAGQGLEPQYLAPEASVLPLDEPANI